VLHKSVVLRVMRNTTYLGNSLLDDAVEWLRSRLPEGWRLTLSSERRQGLRGDARLTVRGPDGATGRLIVEVKRRMSPRQAAEAVAGLRGVAGRKRAKGVLLVSDYLSEFSRKRLRTGGVNYLDLTGNSWIALDRPGLLIDTQGSDQDPSPPRRGIRSLKGPKAARIVRGLCDRRPPIGVRELARLTKSNPGYVSRVIDFLVSEDLVQRDRDGQVTGTNWQELILRWSKDYSLTKANRAVPCLAARGLNVVIDRLPVYEKPYALTGSVAVPMEASIASSRLLACYVDNPQQAAGILDLRLAETGANVLLLEPFDRVVYDRTRTEDGLVKVALSQCAVDLLTGAGRGPSEADALLAWMAKNEDAWRT